MSTQKSTKEKIKFLLRTNKFLIVLIITVLIGLGIIGQLGFFIAIALMLTVHLLRKTNLSELGLCKPKSWTKILFLSLTLTIIILGIFNYLLNPLLFELFPPESKDLSRYDALRGNIPMLLIALMISWITAAFAEEIIWRGYILKNIAKLLGDKNYSWIISLIITSSLFGLLHFVQGPIGIIQTGIVGLIFGLIFIVNGKNNLWMNILIHGIIDTISMIAIYFGMV
ncbi:CPBP family intramembrane metalloprotease [Polaribacter batillariae]|uniref:CPBP family intramembrane metalloprotease n=1 Tax=Polaribacter batillariae TaxID=2808900 RepID=A0ABX7SUB6_9FLAO|nr:type II CAAX endopeptidase family protein [Polaribacter batillariae]QTD37146.1 CPBP family intramembrane metalloprotease [Polaribacter batillariae]